MQHEASPDDATQPAPREPASRGAVAGIIATAIYAAVLCWFRFVDVYHTHAADTGILIAINNLARVVFAACLFWIIYRAGALCLDAVARKSFRELGIATRLALGFFTGAGAWHAVLLLLGYLKLYRPSIAIVLTLPVILFSGGHLAATMRDVRHALAAAVTRVRAASATARTITCALAAAMLAAFALLLLVKGLYPSGGHDYFVHYFHYYQAVVERGDIWPNPVWYHYYYSKGAGLFFLAMLLTDPLAPQLVTFCFVGAAALALWLLLGRIAPDTPWPLAGTALFLALQIYTPGLRAMDRNQGGWGDFEKLHELNASLIIAVVWMTAEALEHRSRAFMAGTLSAIVAAVIINTTIAFYLGGVFTVLMIGYALARTWHRSLVCLAFAAASGVALAVIFAVNHLATGLVSDQGILVLWRFADPEKLAAWGVLPLVLTTYWGTVGMVNAHLRFSPALVEFLAKALRFDLVFPLWLAGTAMAATALARGAMRRPATSEIVLVAAAVTFLALALAVGRGQPTSFYRYASFTLPIATALGVTLILSPSEKALRLSRLARSPLLPAAALIACLAASTLYMPAGAFRAVTLNALRFAAGAFGIDTAYARQDGWPGRLAWGAVYPGARGAFAVTGPRTPIWSLHTHTYCMLPGCRVETYPSFVMTPDWDRVMFGPPDEAETVLRKAGRDHFLFSRELVVTDPLPRSPLFAPGAIADRLGIRWTDGTTTLLTWKGPDTRPLDETWLADYRRAVESSGTAASFPYDDLRRIFAQLRATPHPWRPFELPWRSNRPF